MPDRLQVRARLELTTPGFHRSVLSDFRDRLMEEGRAGRLLDPALAELKEAGWSASAPRSALTPPMSWRLYGT